jgi:hypothetical protein
MRVRFKFASHSGAGRGCGDTARRGLPCPACPVGRSVSPPGGDNLECPTDNLSLSCII